MQLFIINLGKTQLDEQQFAAEVRSPLTTELSSPMPHLNVPRTYALTKIKTCVYLSLQGRAL
ncbi:MAG: hypothetical protein DSM106950_18655 [Stigonema ocellatum SAG 48.90 = DSM 106950]|nr:hypothetical protein [Stigonema ocellatum SAG 48.90 = DSM 106950]